MKQNAEERKYIELHKFNQRYSSEDFSIDGFSAVKDAFYSFKAQILIESITFLSNLSMLNDIYGVKNSSGL